MINQTIIQRFYLSKRREIKMIRTYVDITGEYYDRVEYIREVSDTFSIVESDLMKVFNYKKSSKKQKLKDK